MGQENYNVIGVMSGTSLDGLDLAHIRFKIDSGRWSFEMLETETVAYPKDWVQTLKAAVGFPDGELAKLNENYTRLLGNLISGFIQRNGIHDLDAVCSHGHTVLHQPQNGLTLQVGNLPEIAERTAQKVVCDFRVQDVALGGQGAPLVPIGDRILFPEYDFCLNLGGFSNVSFEEDNKRIAFDISPVNTVLNFYANRLGLDYDDKGKISAAGNLDPELFAALNALEFYSNGYPKSLGFEFVMQTVLPLIEAFPIPEADKMRTFTEHIAFQTALALPKKSGKMLVSGGGAYNVFLLDRLRFHLPDLELVIPTPAILEFKEALIFALLGVLKLRGETNVLASVTGASRDHSSGIIFEKA